MPRPPLLACCCNCRVWKQTDLSCQQAAWAEDCFRDKPADRFGFTVTCALKRAGPFKRAGHPGGHGRGYALTAANGECAWTSRRLRPAVGPPTPRSRSWTCQGGLRSSRDRKATTVPLPPGAGSCIGGHHRYLRIFYFKAAPRRRMLGRFTLRILSLSAVQP